MFGTDQQPNILFIMTDHQRADSLNMHCAGVEVTPNLNRLAADSTIFSRAYTTCPLCVPARTALATGIYPTKNGVVFNDWQGQTAGEVKPIHQYLVEAGYDLGHVGVQHVRLQPSLRDRVDFSMWITQEDHTAYCEEHGVVESTFDADPERRTEVQELQDGRYVNQRYSNTHCSVWPHDTEHFKDIFFARHAEDFLRRQRSEPFALFVNFWAPHPPLRVPEPYASLFPPDEITLPANVGVPASKEPSNRRQGIAAQLATDVSMDQWRRVWVTHLGLVRLADDAIGDIIETLNDAGLADNTVIVFTSDHGDHLGQHAMYQKMEMYEQAIRVPLIVHHPSGDAHVCPTPVSHLDLLPTVLDMTGIEVPQDLDGIPLTDTVLQGTPPQSRPIFSQYSGNPALGDIRRCVITERYKYIFDPKAPLPELYDLETDPLEMTNLAGDAAEQDTLKKLHVCCHEWGQNQNDWT